MLESQQNKKGFKKNHITIILDYSEDSEPTTIDNGSPPIVVDPRIKPSPQGTDDKPVETIRFVNPNLSKQGENTITWNKELDESDITLIIEYPWRKSPSSPTVTERIIKQIPKGSRDFENGTYTLSPSNEKEKKIFNTTVTVTIHYELNGVAKTKSEKIEHLTCSG